MDDTFEAQHREQAGEERHRINQEEDEEAEHHLLLVRRNAQESHGCQIQRDKKPSPSNLQPSSKLRSLCKEEVPPQGTRERERDSRLDHAAERGERGSMSPCPLHLHAQTSTADMVVRTLKDNLQ